MGTRLIGGIVLAFLLAMPARVLLAADPAGQVTAANGTVTALSERGVTRFLAEGSDLFKGDRVDTGSDASVSMRFSDGATFELGEEATMSVDNYAYGGAAEPAFSARVLKGVFRFVTGLIPKEKPNSMLVQLTVATIGIRGTSVVGEVGPTSATIILMEPEEPTPTAIEVSNQFGSVTIDEPGYGTEIPDANSPPSPPRRMALRTVQNLMRTIQSIQRINVPRVRVP